MQPGTMSELALSSDRSAIYLAYAVGGSCAGQVVGVSTAGGAMVPLDSGSLANPPPDSTGYAGGAPAVSPNGTQVAWVRVVCHPSAPSPTDVDQTLITNAATHSGQVLVLPGSAGMPLSWGGAGGDLLMGNDSSGVEEIFRLSADDKVTSTLTVRAPDSGCSLEAASFLPGSETVAAVENCLHPNLYGGNKLIEVDPATGKLVRTLVTLTDGSEFSTFSLDRSGTWVLYQIGPLGYETSTQQRTLFLLHDGVTTKVSCAVALSDPIW